MWPLRDWEVEEELALVPGEPGDVEGKPGQRWSSRELPGPILSGGWGMREGEQTPSAWGSSVALTPMPSASKAPPHAGH